MGTLVFVLHCFQKKSKRGIATPKEYMNIIRARLKVADGKPNMAYVKPSQSALQDSLLSDLQENNGRCE